MLHRLAVVYYSSSKLTGPWHRDGNILARPPPIDNPGRVSPWAPHVTRLGNDRYIAFYCVSSFGTPNSAIGVAVSTTGEPGSFQDYGALFGSSDETPYNALDPSLAIGVDGEPYLSFGSYFEGIFLTKLDRGLIKTAEDAPPPLPKPSPDGGDDDVHIQKSEEDAEEETLSNTAVSSRSPAWTAPRNATSISSLPRPPVLDLRTIQLATGYSWRNSVESSGLYYKSGWWYLFVSSGQCCGFDTTRLPEPNTREYKVLVGRSKSIEGPYTDRNGTSMLQGGGSILLSSFDRYYAPGGQSIFLDPQSQREVMVFHYSDPKEANAYARLGIYYVDWEGDWPIVKGK